VRKAKFKTLLLAAFATTTLMGLPRAAQAKNPRSCNDGYVYLGSGEYKKSIKKLSACLRSNSLTNESRAIAYYNRSLSYYYRSEALFKEGNYERADKLFYKSLEDVDMSIKLDPAGTPKAYCHRGWLELEESWGEYGGEDLKKGIAMGAPEDLCNGNTLD
jgi:tetratricopeptide (TPR) repeat protein